MLFNSIEFLFYLPIVFLLYWLVFKRLKYQNAFIVIASYVFYGWWEWKFLVLIFITTLFSYLSGIGIKKFPTYRKLVLWGNVLLNLGILCLFKYFNFFSENLQALFNSFGIHLDWVTLNLILPVGISFYTFQALSYSIDVYRDKIEPTRDIIAFFAFISFFPQLVAGPIERATNLLPQFLKSRSFDYPTAVDGCRQILWGLFKKMVVADNCAIGVNEIFSDYNSLGGGNLWLGALLFTFQIYGDFSGYSDIAIGTAKLFGINLMRNFNFPYFSRDIAEFWRRWHISLTTWFRDYIYIPLGGSRCKKSKVVRNTFIIFLTSGFWHGANWTFIVWGAYHALLFIPLIITDKNRKFTNSVASGRYLPSFTESLFMAWTFILVLIGWIIFRADNISHAWEYISRMFTHWYFTQPIIGFKALMWISVLMLIEWIQRERQHAFDFSGRKLMSNKVVRWSVYAVTFVICIVFSGEQTNFIYFQF